MSTFVIVGVGGLGCPLALALAMAGAERLVLVDDDVVDLSNLQRQILYRTADVGAAKVDAARAALARRGFTRVEAVRARFDGDSARALIHDADVVCDGSDNLATKFLVNDVCRAAGRACVIAAAIRSTGTVFPVAAAGGACYRCLFEAPPEEELESCGDAGVFGATCGLVAAWQARAALALARGESDCQVILVDGIDARGIEVRPRAGCCQPAAEAHA